MKKTANTKYTVNQIANLTGAAPNPNSTLDAINAVQCPITGGQLEYKHLVNGPDKAKWFNACLKEVTRLTQGRKQGDTPGTNTFFFIHPKTIPQGRMATYLRIVTSFQPQKEGPYHVSFTVGGNLIDYPGIMYMPFADLNTAKVLFNSVVSIDNAKFFGIGIKNFYLNIDKTRFEYMLIPLKILPEEIIKHYNLKDIVYNSNVLVEI